MIRSLATALGGLCLFGISLADAGEVINVAVNTAHVLHLQRDAAVVMVAIPAIADVSVESPWLIFIFGIEPGKTNFYVLDDDDGVILELALVVTLIDDRQVTINRPQEETTLSCAPRCATVGTPVGSKSPAATAGSGGGT
ncbi:MAG: pilus assembly protein N-terminal domain-containing protein [Alphaproteobacteria bacterium]